MSARRKLIAGIPLVAGAFFLGLAAGPAFADTVPYTLTLKDHKFTPAELQVPANEKFELKVINQDPTPAEFESHELYRQKLITGGSQVTISAGPLTPGTYEFFDGFHDREARGHIVAK
jgi:hypothetical protein